MLPKSPAAPSLSTNFRNIDKLPFMQVGCFPDHSPFSWQVLFSMPLRTYELLQKKDTVVPTFAWCPVVSPGPPVTFLYPLTSPPGSEQFLSSTAKSEKKKRTVISLSHPVLEQSLFIFQWIKNMVLAVVLKRITKRNLLIENACIRHVFPCIFKLRTISFYI